MTSILQCGHALYCYIFYIFWRRFEILSSDKRWYKRILGMARRELLSFWAGIRPISWCKERRRRCHYDGSSRFVWEKVLSVVSWWWNNEGTGKIVCTIEVNSSIPRGILLLLNSCFVRRTSIYIKYGKYHFYKYLTISINCSQDLTYYSSLLFFCESEIFRILKFCFISKLSKSRGNLTKTFAAKPSGLCWFGDLLTIRPRWFFILLKCFPGEVFFVSLLFLCSSILSSLTALAIEEAYTSAFITMDGNVPDFWRPPFAYHVDRWGCQHLFAALYFWPCKDSFMICNKPTALKS